MLDVLKIKKNFGDNNVFEDLDLNIKKGETVVVVGKSGEGKTTLLRCITGLEKCDYGKIIINNKVFCSDGKYAEGKLLKEIRKDIGVVFQNFNLFPHMTVMENIIEAPIKVLKVNKDEAKERALKLLEKLSMKGKENSYPNELSGGQKQRVAIARALAMEPKILCFDEPTSALDPETTLEVSNIIKKLNKEGISIMIITHDIDFAKDVSDRVLTMDKGKLK
ncbi:amino acid ABC transporter ATP-binding protein [Clostridium sp. Ade.TY]|uniref:amino acid ABC transporter ATP-binding protein n=1 Tax=Clostridium sp. Ade.TY TaxID=1391647 RepID=UPI00042089DF|nr:amino acid ABC transporter ATP-binding protein [Clostridium sp. Ade.TY]